MNRFKRKMLKQKNVLFMATLFVILFSAVSFFIVFHAETRTVIASLTTSDDDSKQDDKTEGTEGGPLYSTPIPTATPKPEKENKKEDKKEEKNDEPKKSFLSFLTPATPTPTPTPVPTPTPSPTPEPTPVPTPMPNLVEYTGPVYHIFFHPLVYRPELAFDGSASAQGMDDYMATVKEFNNVINSLYKNGYVMADLEDFYGYETKEDGSVKYERKYVPFPEGKKPLIISEDDVNYYQYMREGGCVFKLVLDENGNVRDYTIDENGVETLSDDRDMVTIIDKFVEEHPDFSFNGTKGLLAPTGFDGILGYQTQYDSPTRESEIEEAKKVVARLKETGWKFASHSYAHAHMSRMSAASVRSDVKQWMDEVGSLVGETTVWIYPYGDAVKNGTEAHQAMEDAGFRIFCGVGPQPYEQIRGETVFQDRMNIDGISLRRPDDSYFKDMFINSEVIDLEGRSGKPAQ